MAVKIRLARGGSKKRPYYRIVVADLRAPRDGKYIERVGSYNPLLPKDHEDRIKLDIDRIKEWLSKGAKPTYIALSLCFSFNLVSSYFSP